MNAISAYLTTLVFVAQQRLGKATKGATAVEYGLLVALIAAVIITLPQGLRACQFSTPAVLGLRV